MEQLQPSNVEELKYILRDNFEGKDHQYLDVKANKIFRAI